MDEPSNAKLFAMCVAASIAGLAAKGHFPEFENTHILVLGIAALTVLMLVDGFVDGITG